MLLGAVILLLITLAVNIVFFISLKKKMTLTAAVPPDLDKYFSGIKDEFSRTRSEEMQRDKLAREELTGALKSFEEKLMGRSDAMQDRQEKMAEKLDERFEKIRLTVEGRLEKIREENSGKLENIRHTVDEKLHEALEKRLGDSFKIVSDKLEEVHKGLGEMQELAAGVGDLKKVLSNVKTRGVFGEIQLGNILEQILAPGQYESNVRISGSGSENVEFAVRIPRDADGSEFIYLPIDSKFPMEKYEQYVTSCESGDAEAVQKHSKELENTLKNCAEDIASKYIVPPYSTDYAILFLPVEGLYAEIARRSSLISLLQREKKVLVTGPSTLAALLNSLQMGFRTLAIQKRSGEVWQVLLSVKKEFSKFEEVLGKVQRKIDLAGKEMQNLVGPRTRQLNKALDRLEYMEKDKGGSEDEE